MDEKLSLKDEIRSKILIEITSGNFSVNSVITEKKLIEMFQVSKSPVREALVALCNERVLESMPRYGYRIVQLDSQSILDAIEVRMLLEMAAYDKAVARMGQEEIDILKRHNEAHDRNRIEADVLTHWDNNNQFHFLLAGFAGNTLLSEMLEKTLGILTRAYAQYYWNRWQSFTTSMDIESHTAILGLLDKRDFAGAKEKLREDILFMGEQLGIRR